jgi:hypothetical protein
MMRSATIAAAAALALTPASAGAKDTAVATVARSTSVDVYGGHAVWSTWDAAAGAYRLTEYAGGRARTLPVAPNAVPFDADVGPDASGRPAIVYSRCRRAPLSPWALDGRRGCDLYAFRSGREVRLARADSAADEYFPALWRGRLAFTRTYRDGQRLLYWRALGHPGPSHRLRGGPTAEPAVPADLDLRFGTVAFVWRYEFGAELRVATTSGEGRRLVRIPGSGAAANQLAAEGPSIAGGSVYWMLAVSGDEPAWSRIRRVRLAAGRQQQSDTRIDRASAGFAHDRSASWYVSQAGADVFEIHRATGLRYERADPIALH